MKIAILGTRGIPARYGGFETLAEQLSKRLVEQGHEVTVYCRRPFTTPGDMVDPRIRRVILPTIYSKSLDTTSHTFLSVLHVIFTDVEVVLLCNVANSPWAWIPRLFGKPTVLNVDGLDRKRRKWKVFARSYLFLCELLALITPTRIVTDALTIQKYFWRRYRKRSAMIAYGAEALDDGSKLEAFGLQSEKFILYVSRLEPENNPELVIRAYRKVQTDWPLVVVGGNRYDGHIVNYLKSLADDRVVFPGGIYGKQYWQLLRNAGLYISACEAGGSHPALVDAMATRNAVLYLDTPENREVADDCGVAFRREVADLAAQMRRLIRDATLRKELGQRAQRRAETLFRWDDVTERYEALFSEVLNKRAASPAVTAASERTGALPAPGGEAGSPLVVFSPAPVGDHLAGSHLSPAEGKGKLTGR